WNRAPGREEVRRALHVLPQGEADADDEAGVDEQDQVIEPRKRDLHGCVWGYGLLAARRLESRGTAIARRPNGAKRPARNQATTGGRPECARARCDCSCRARFRGPGCTPRFTLLWPFLDC